MISQGPYNFFAYYSELAAGALYASGSSNASSFCIPALNTIFSGTRLINRIDSNTPITAGKVGSALLFTAIDIITATSGFATGAALASLNNARKEGDSKAAGYGALAILGISLTARVATRIVEGLQKPSHKGAPPVEIYPSSGSFVVEVSRS